MCHQPATAQALARIKQYGSAGSNVPLLGAGTNQREVDQRRPGRHPRYLTLFGLASTRHDS